MLSHPLSEPTPNKLEPEPPHPPQQESKRIIQMIELHPLLEFDVPHPQPVAVKSLIYCLQRVYLWFIICTIA